MSKRLYTHGMRPLVISHAACGGHAPENTLAGIRKALDFGVDGIEIDVQASSDGVPVLMHDLTVDRTTDGSGKVASMSLEELRTLDTGDEPVPTLDDVLALTIGKALLVIEVKQPGIEEEIAEVVRKRDALSDVMVWSFYPDVLEAMRRVEPRLPGALLIAPESLPRWPKMRGLAVRLGLQGISMFHLGISEQIGGEARRSGLSMYAWTPDPVEHISRLIDLGVDGICTNYPDRAIALLAER